MLMDVKGKIHVNSDSIELIEDEMQTFEVEFDTASSLCTIDIEEEREENEDCAILKLNFIINALNEQNQALFKINKKYLFMFSMQKLEKHGWHNIAISALNEIFEEITSTYGLLITLILQGKLQGKINDVKEMN